MTPLALLCLVPLVWVLYRPIVFKARAEFEKAKAIRIRQERLYRDTEWVEFGKSLKHAKHLGK